VSRPFGAEQILALLESVKGTVREFAAREEKLNQELGLKLASVQRRRDEDTAEANSLLAEQLREKETSTQAARELAKSRFEARKARIIEAHRAAKKETLKSIENKEGSRKHKLQTETLQSRRAYETGLASAESTLAEFKNALAAEQEVLAILEEKARSSFRGYRKFLRLLSSEAGGLPDSARDEYQLLAELRDLLNKTGDDLDRFRKKLFPALFRFTPVWVGLALCLIPLVPLLEQFGIHTFGYLHAGASVIGCLVVGFLLHQVGGRQGGPLAATIATALIKARRLHDVCYEKAETRHTEEINRIETDFQKKTQWVEQEWNLALEEAGQRRDSLPQQIDDQAQRASASNEKYYRLRLDRLEQEHGATVSNLTSSAEKRIQDLGATCVAKEAALNAEYQEHWRKVEADWNTRIRPLFQTIESVNGFADRLFPPWQRELWEGWRPPAQFSDAAKFARIEVDVEKLSEGAPKDPRLELPGPRRFSLPLLLTYPDQGSVVFETTNTGREEIIGALNNLVLRLLSNAPPGRLSFTVIDPVGLGQSFSGVMHLTDYAEHLINSRIWTQTGQIEQRLADLNEHMEKVIQMYLRNEYATIAEYNEQAGNIAEKYHFVVVADFPAAFSDAAARRLLSIATSGARCGVFTLIHWDRRQPVPQDFVPEELRKSSVCITAKGAEFILTGKAIPGTNLLLDDSPAPELAIDFIQKVGISSRDSNRVEVPFEQIAPAEAELWSLETTSELRVPIGRTGATKFQYLAIGKGTRQHALLAGKTGSGKSTLFHVMITNLALWCSPEQVEFYLIDFKKGVEFKCYAANRLPHARVVAIESDREFGLSVLQRLDDELKRRGDLFRKLGVQDIAGYKRAGGTEPIPRSLLIIDEFQELFIEDDKVAQTASLLLDRIVRQGRAFGIHVLLGSQTLGGAYTVARTTLGQMVIRIALQCNEADAYLIMDENNPAPRLLSRPGEGIYNDTAGTMEGNSPFQVVWLPDEVRDQQLGKVRDLADRKTSSRYPGPIVFEGNAPADVRENATLEALLKAESIRPTLSPRIWLGAPNSIKGPTESVFHRQSGNNLLLVGQREEATLSILSVALISLAAQFQRGGARFILCDGNPPGTPGREYLEQIIQAIPHEIILAKQGDLPEILKRLVDQLTTPADAEGVTVDRTPVFLLIHGLQKFNKLRYEEDFGFASSDADTAPNPAVLLNQLICEGTSHGLHVVATCDTYNNVNRFLSRKALSEFEMRVLFQMSANDSSSLIDNPKASTLGLHRAIFYNEQEGYLETFRPYALPSREWIAEASRELARLVRGVAQ
jgi:S-DNA-T family DNA segregation ATPase FtsK/SpoIIIE